MAGSYSTTIEQGADWSRTVAWKNPDGTAIDLSGWTAACQIRDGQTLLATVTTAITGTAGTVSLSLPAAQTAALPAVTAKYDLFLTAPGGAVTRLLAGTVSILPRTTQ